MFFEGKVHALDPTGGAEYSLCGVASDAWETEGQPELRWRPLPTNRKHVDCTGCAKVILHCRRLTVSPRVKVQIELQMAQGE
jgi:hypothetical protein